MADIKTLEATPRTEFGKGAARRTRRANLIPAVLYGHGSDPVHLALPAHATTLALRTANALLDIQMPDGNTQLALPKQVQRDPVRDSIEHIDLIKVERGQQVSVDVPLLLTGTAKPDAVVMLALNIVSVRAEITAIPNELELSVQDLEVGDQLTLGDIALPEGVELSDDPDTLVVSASVARTVEEVVADLESSDAEREAATGEDESEAAAETE